MNIQVFENHKNWPFIKDIFQKFDRKGFRVLLVGGCVRDFLLHRPFRDFDLVTDATPDIIHEIFPEALSFGKVFGVLKLVLEDSYIEISSFRKDGPYKDGRHPTYVLFGDEKEDARRRDFTINSLFYDIKRDCVIDYFFGERDLKNKIIRTVGSPRKRFLEDYLRILRAIRFASEFNFEIEEETFLTMMDLSSKVLSISKERIQQELEKLFLSSYSLKGINLLIQTSLFDFLFPSYNLHKRNKNKRALELWCKTKWFLQRFHSPSLFFILSGFFLNQVQLWVEEKKYSRKEAVENCINMLRNLKFSKKSF